jgi:hypothetical protein
MRFMLNCFKTGDCAAIVGVQSDDLKLLREMCKAVNNVVYLHHSAFYRNDGTSDRPQWTGIDASNTFETGKHLL